MLQRWMMFGMLILTAMGCSDPAGAQTSPAEKSEEASERKTEFAEDRAPAPAKMIAFDADRAMKYLKMLCKIGPRISGSDGMREQQEILKKHFTELGGKVTFQTFEGRQPSQKRGVVCKNMIVTWHPERARRVILCGHYDTRPMADEEPLKRDWTKPFLSANDGTSTTALLMELAHHMKDFPSSVGVEFVIFDAEEWLFDREAGDRYFLGSEHFAKEYKQRPPEHKYIAAILFDLFAGKNARIKVEGNSRYFAGALVEDVWRVAFELKAKSFVWEPGSEVLDDHLALNRVGIPAIDLIDFEYPHWHKLSDTPENCSGEQMAEVAKVITVWLQRVK